MNWCNTSINAEMIPEPRSPKLAKFDERDVNRIFNDDLFTLSFLNWKKGIINDSLDMVAQVFEWRKENEVGGEIADSVLLDIL